MSRSLTEDLETRYKRPFSRGLTRRGRVWSSARTRGTHNHRCVEQRSPLATTTTTFPSTTPALQNVRLFVGEPPTEPTEPAGPAAAKCVWAAIWLWRYRRSVRFIVTTRFTRPFKLSILDPQHSALEARSVNRNHHNSSSHRLIRCLEISVGERTQARRARVSVRVFLQSVVSSVLIRSGLVVVGAFGSTNTSNAGGGLFGQPKPTTGFGAFGGGGTFGSTAAAPAPAFGGGGAFGSSTPAAGTSTGTGLFGSQPSTSTSAFGGGGGGLFGANKPATGFGTTPSKWLVSYFRLRFRY